MAYLNKVQHKLEFSKCSKYLHQMKYLPIALIFPIKACMPRKVSSFIDLSCPLINSELVAKMFRLSSVRLTPPIVATSLMSSSSLLVRKKTYKINFTDLCLNTSGNPSLQQFKPLIPGMRQSYLVFRKIFLHYVAFPFTVTNTYSKRKICGSIIQVLL